MALPPSQGRLAHHRPEARHRGTAGVGYLEQIAGRVFFPELWDVRTELEEAGPAP